jgi:hypothetical protein
MNRLILVVVSILLGWRAVLTVRNDRMNSTLMVIRVAVITVDHHLIPHQVIIPPLATGIRRLIEDTEVNRYKLLTRFRHSLVFIRYF